MATAPYSYLKRFRLTGLIEFTYRDYSFGATYYGRKSESGWTSFEQRYKIGLLGYVYHPKLVTFSANITFRKDNMKAESNLNRDEKDMNYDFSATFLATTPVSADVYVTRTDSTIEGEGTPPYDITSNYYGARLYYRSRRYPSLRLEYNHWDYIIEREKGVRVMGDDFYYDENGNPVRSGLIIEKKRVKEKTSVDRVSVYMDGYMKSINTNYHMTAYLSDYTSPFRSYTGKEVITTTYTVIKKENALATSFQYSDIDVVKLTRAAVNARLFPIGRLSHAYEYEYLTSETAGERIDSQTLTNHLLYRFSRLIFGSAHLRYVFGKRDGVNEDSYDINLGLNYGKPVKDFDLVSYYRFNLDNDERRGEYKYMENSLGFGLSTRKITWGRVYSNYDLSFRKYEISFLQEVKKDSEESEIFNDISEESRTFNNISEGFNSLQHKMRIGINGKGPGRAYWNMEAELRIFDSELKNDRAGFWFGEEPWAEEIRLYTISGDVGYPIGHRGMATFMGGYTTGRINTEHAEKYYYEGRINYRLLRNLNVLAWWREEWRNKGWWAGFPAQEILRREFGWKTREYQIELYYSIYRVIISLEYNAYRLKEGPFETWYNRLFLKLSRKL